MSSSPLRYVVLAVVLCALLSVGQCRGGRDRRPKAQTEVSSSGKPLLKRPPGRSYKTILSVDGGGVRGILAAKILVEVEQAIKRYLVNNPSLLPLDVEIASVDDFDINLADYFDCMTGVSAGAWATLYLASRGGQGASRFVLDDPAIVEKYGVIPDGGAEGLLVFFNEYSSVIFPVQELDPSLGDPLDVTNPGAPGVLAPLHTLDGLERTLEAFLGDTTLADLDTSYLMPALDLMTQDTVFFVQNRFKKRAVTASATLKTRTAVRPAPVKNDSFDSDFEFEEGKDYYLRDIGTAGAAIPSVFPAKEVSQVGSDEVEFVFIDGILPVETTALPATFFVASETGLHGVENIAMLSVGTGLATSDLNPFANSGIAGWLENGLLLGVVSTTGQESLATLMDYLYYSNPAVQPYQYLRVQTAAPVTSEEGMALSVVDQPVVVDVIEAIGSRVVEEYRDAIDTFVRDFIFG